MGAFTKPKLEYLEAGASCSTFVRFLATGGFATALHWGLMALLVGLNLTSATVATAAGAALGAIINYLLQFHITFQARARHSRAMPTYLAVLCSSWLANLLIFMGFHTGLAVAAAPAQGLTTLLVALMNFWLYKTVVFHEQRATTAQP